MTSRLLHAAPWVAVFALAFGYRVYLIVEYPPMYWWDAFARIWESDHLFVRAWLPLAQVPVIWIDDPVALRCVYALFAAAAAVTTGIALTRIWSLWHGLTFAFVVALMPLFVKWSIVPYQEPLLLTFVGLSMIAFPRGLEDKSGSVPWLGAAALAAAALCRYEAWGFAMILAGFAMIRRRWRALRFLIPIAVIMILWLATTSLRDPMMGPPRLGNGPASISSLPLGDLYEVIEDTTFIIAKKVQKQMTWIAIFLAAWGFIVSVVKARRGDREVALFGLSLFGLSVIRAAAAHTTTTRMIVFPCVWVGLYAVVGWFDLWRRGELLVTRKLPEAGFVKPMFFAVNLVATVAFTSHVMWGYYKTSHKTARNTARELTPEMNLARTLAELPEHISVAIFPRNMRNILRESTVAAIFANAPSLDPLDARWTYEGKAPDAPVSVPDAMVHFRNGRYVLVEAPDGR